MLGVSPSATKKEIKAAFYALSQKYHPDKNLGKDDSKEKYQKIGEAYQILSDDTLREKYNKENSIFNKNRRNVQSEFGFDLRSRYSRTAHTFRTANNYERRWDHPGAKERQRNEENSRIHFDRLDKSGRSGSTSFLIVASLVITAFFVASMNSSE